MRKQIYINQVVTPLLSDLYKKWQPGFLDLKSFSLACLLTINFYLEKNATVLYSFSKDKVTVSVKGAHTGSEGLVTDNYKEMQDFIVYMKTIGPKEAMDSHQHICGRQIINIFLIFFIWKLYTYAHTYTHMHMYIYYIYSSWGQEI